MLQNLSKKEALENEVEFLSKNILELNQKLIESQRAKTLFLSLVANNLNDPMTAILGMLPHLKICNDEKNEGIFSTIYGESLDLAFKIQNLITVAEIESGNLSNSYALTNVQSIVDEALNGLRYLAKNRNIKIETSYTVQNEIVTDPKKVSIILKNLIANGCMYSPEKQSVIVDVQSDGTVLKISVKNRSNEIKVGHKPEIFTRFSQKIDSRHGLGIGLSIVRELCQSLDGSVDYDASNGIVSFEVNLPLDASMQNFEACGSDSFLFESFDDAIEI